MFKRKKKTNVMKRKAIRFIKKVIEPELDRELKENPDMDLVLIDFEIGEEGCYFLKNDQKSKKFSGKLLRAVTEVALDYDIQSTALGSYSKPSKFTFFKKITNA